MKRKFKIGDRVEVKDEDIKGTVTQVNDKWISIIDEHGFERKYHADELVCAQGFDFNKIKANPIRKKEKAEAKKRTKFPSKKKEIILDLHAEKIPPRYFYHRSIPEGQIKFFRDQLKKMKSSHTGKWIIIHGEGSGKLKKEVIKILRSEGYEIYDAPYTHYGKGATVVEKKKN